MNAYQLLQTEAKSSAGAGSVSKPVSLGVPVLTVAGGHFVSRMGASFMQAAGLPEWVASDDADFVRRAVALSQDRQALLKLKIGMRDRLLALPAWDIDAYARDVQAAVRHMWAARVAELHAD